jgi:isopenicillin-N N-acyltransferase-like protein
MNLFSRPRFLLLGSPLVLMLSFAGFRLAALTPEQELLRQTCATLAAVLDPASGTTKSLVTTLKLVRAEGLPKELAGAKVDLAMAGTEHLRVGTSIKGERIELGRAGQELWVWQPAKQFAVVGSPTVAKYAGAPGSLDRRKLGPTVGRWPRAGLKLLPHFTQVEAGPAETIDGGKCRVLQVRPGTAMRALFRLPESRLTLWVKSGETLPARIDYTDGRALHATIELRETHLGADLRDSTWQLHPPEGTPIERVALSHLSRCLESSWRTFGGSGSAKSRNGEPAGTVLLARHGTGRLELRDGNRVLYLRGSPEAMGEQHGALMRTQVRDLVSRVLYGVGVGSSFAKGQWFFGTIESCEARLAKFIEPRHLREMDALARAAGCDREEIRLANFFPELFHCSGFALLGEATSGGRVFHGRVLDYMKGAGLEQNAVVVVSRPEEGHAWVNIGYAGFIGSVTAMNEAGISIGEMGGRGEGQWDGKPMAQLLREVMEKAATLEEAVAIMRRGPRTCEYYYVIADGKQKSAVGIKATPEIFEVVPAGGTHPQLDTPIKDAVVLSAGERYRELVRRVQSGYGQFDAGTARDLMTRPVCMSSNIQSVLFAPDTLDFWVANADGANVASHSPYTHYNLRELLKGKRP